MLYIPFFSPLSMLSNFTDHFLQTREANRHGEKVMWEHRKEEIIKRGRGNKSQLAHPLSSAREIAEQSFPLIMYIFVSGSCTSNLGIAPQAQSKVYL